MKNKNKNFETDAVRAGIERSQFGEHSEGLFLTSSFVFKNAQEAAKRFSGEEPGNVYSRFTNPTVKTFEERLASLEGAEQCIATSSGMSAILATFMALCKPGDHVVVSKSIFGTSVQLFNNFLAKWGLNISFVDLPDLNSWEEATTKNTKFYFIETPSNPLTEIVDLKKLSQLAKSKKVKLIVDNCFCTPALQKPIEHGADIIIHSATKYLDGQGRCLGGAVLGKKRQMNEIYTFLRNTGVSLSPFNAWVFLKGLETLKIRMDQQSDNAMKLATYLEKNKKITQVYYPGLKSHPQHKIALSQQSSGGAVLSFVLKGGQKAAWQVINKTKLMSITANLGDTKTTITHPATTTHSRLTQEQRNDAGIDDGLVRIAVGLEHIEDIISDLNI
ncbi:MAG: O-succinylhomoserine sulfhydrylase [Methylophilaceae bacterium]|jgi:O-succinylhomoserine sulfhydrylase|nr:O-succinylhomoserine sulfhydrylase [Methylophilaceae bacterium]NCV27306.1 O-succinylhomoserine sulfhydrylase [Nitrosomonadales bacterium]NCV37948.1 O-succinylhomoserine sulfhydrylase [Betaproteobacteria bacterium]NCV54111.1 O-succinylhomoserine sulfhydrylase [Betaproteobacteria bacterium]NCW62549.1 O-succinylhomoserine sulfhydrylase [Betaproteobacteria bacterium]